MINSKRAPETMCSSAKRGTIRSLAPTTATIDWKVGRGADRLSGRRGNDELLGADGDDILEGGEGDDLLQGDGGSDVLLGGAGHDTLYGHNLSGANDDGAVDYLYGDFGTSANEPGSGGDRLDGQGGNDLLFGEGGDDLLVAAAGADLINYGPGEGAQPADFVPPTPTPPPAPLNPADAPQPATLAGGGAERGWWSQLGISASGSGVSGGSGLSIEPAVGAASAHGHRHRVGRRSAGQF